MRRLSLGSILFVCASLALIGCTSAEKHVARGDTHALRGRYGQALTEYEKAQSKDPSLGLETKIRETQVFLFLDEGDRAVDSARWTQAERAYERVRRLDPGHPEIDARFVALSEARANWHFRAGQQLLNSNQTLEAIAEFEEALIHDPAHARASQALTRAHEIKVQREGQANTAFEEGKRARAEDKYEEAIERFRLAIELNPLHTEARHELKSTRTAYVEFLVASGDRLAASGDWTEAREYYQQARTQRPNTPGLGQRLDRSEREVEALGWIRTGDEALQAGEWSDAYVAFDRARCLTALPESFLERLERARAELSKQLLAEAKEAQKDGRYEDALLAYQDLAEIEVSASVGRDAVDRLTIALDEAESHYQLASEAEVEGDLQRAQTHFVRCPQHTGAIRRRCRAARSPRQGTAIGREPLRTGLFRPRAWPG